MLQHPLGVKAGNDLVGVWVPPAHGVEDDTPGLDLVHESGADELGDGGAAVDGGAGLVVEVVFGFEDFNGDAVLGEQDGEEEARGAGAYDEDLIK